MTYEVRFANGERLRGESLDDARRCIDAARKRGHAEARFPASIWEVPESDFAVVDPIDAPERFGRAARVARLRISPGGPIERHVL